MDKFKAYSINIYAAQVLAGGNSDNTFDIINSGRAFILRSVIFDISIHRVNAVGFPAPIEALPLAMNNSQLFRLEIQPLPIGVQFCSPFENILLPAFTDNNGQTIQIFNPCDLKLNSMYSNQGLRCLWYHTNLDLIEAYSIQASLIIEIEDLNIIYNG